MYIFQHIVQFVFYPSNLSRAMNFACKLYVIAGLIICYRDSFSDCNFAFYKCALKFSSSLNYNEIFSIIDAAAKHARRNSRIAVVVSIAHVTISQEYDFNFDFTSLMAAMIVKF